MLLLHLLAGTLRIATKAKQSRAMLHSGLYSDEKLLPSERKLHAWQIRTSLEGCSLPDGGITGCELYVRNCRTVAGVK